MFYFVKTPGWLKKVYPACIWEVPGENQAVYLSFDDGPHPVHTPFVLDELKKYNAKATFFLHWKKRNRTPRHLQADPGRRPCSGQPHL
jgi:peptidoglycan/xylan/chitin deacetylase (PgdA/CDA1 family)